MAANYQRRIDRQVLPEGEWQRTIWTEDWRDYDLVPKEQLEFSRLADMDDRSIQKVMREVDSQELCWALRGEPAEVQDKVFRNMSKRAAQMLKEDMEFAGPIKVSAHDDAQRKIIEVINRLVELEEIPDPLEPTI